MARTRLLLVRGDDPDIVAELAGQRLEHIETGGVDAIIVGQQDTHQAGTSSRVSPPM